MKKFFNAILAIVLSFAVMYVTAETASATKCPNDSCVYNATVSEPANCAHGNVWKYKCKKCGHTYYEDDDQRTDEHQRVHVPAKEPTETERGNIEHLKCTVCGKCFRVDDPECEYYISVEIPRIGGEPIFTSVSYDKTVANWMDTIAFRVEYHSDEMLKSVGVIEAIGKNTGNKIELSGGSWEENTGLLRIENEYDPESWNGSVTFYRTFCPSDSPDDYYFYLASSPTIAQSEEVQQLFYEKNACFTVRLADDVDAKCYSNEDTELASKLQGLEDGDVAVLKLYNGRIFTKDCQDAIKGKDVRLVIPCGDWSYAELNGKDIVNQTKDITVSMSMSGSGRADADDGGPFFALRFTFPNNGVLPGKMRYYYDYQYVYDFAKEGIDSRIITADDVMKAMKLYYINNGMLVLEPDGINKTQDWIILELNHNSSFLASSFSPIIMQSYSAKLSKSTFVYNGNVQKPTVRCNKSGCRITYSNSKSKSIGTYKVKVDAPKNGYGTYTFKYTIKPPTVKGLKLTSPKAKKLKLVWMKAKGGVKYKIAYRVKGKSTWKITTTTNTSKVLKSLKGGKTYQVKIRAYKKVSGTTYYGSWSAVKAKKVKK